MTKGTFWIEKNPGGGISIGIEDYDVEAFGGCDYEWIYTMDRINTEKFIATLRETLRETQTNTAHDSGYGSATPEPSLEEMITEEFGIHLDKKSMMLWFDENAITYDFSSWVHNKLSTTHDLLRRGK